MKKNKTKLKQSGKISNGNLGVKLQLFVLLLEKASSCDYSSKELSSV